MRILYLVPGLQHPTMRGALRHYHLLRYVAQRHRVTVLALAKHPVTAAAVREIEPQVEHLRVFPIADMGSSGSSRQRANWPVARVGRRVGTWRAMRRMRAAFWTLARRGEFDLILFHGKEIYPVIAGYQGVPIVADFCDATTVRLRGALRHASPLQFPWRLLRYGRVVRFERQLLNQTRHLAFISARDRDAVLPSGAPAAIIPNGIDLAYWTRTASSTASNVIVFTGLLDYPPNADAASFLVDRVLPRVRRQIPGVEAWIVGRDPEPSLVARGQRVPGVVVTGAVDDLRPYLERASVFVAPLRFASGLQNKLLEALAMRVPVVTTPVSAAGLGLDGSGVPVRVADGPDALARATVDLLAQPEQRHAMARAGRVFVERHFDWEESGRRLEALCFEALEHPGSSDSEPGEPAPLVASGVTRPDHGTARKGHADV